MSQDRQTSPELPPGYARDLVDLFRRIQPPEPLTRRELARKARVSESYLSEVLRGRKTPSPATAAKIAEAYGARADRVLEARRLAESQAELSRHQKKQAETTKCAPPASEQAPPGAPRRSLARPWVPVLGATALATTLAGTAALATRPDAGHALLITGSVTCESGRPVVGIWIAAATGQRDSGYAHLGLAATAPSAESTATYSYRLAHGGSYVVHAGCGGTASDWYSRSFSALLSRRVAALRCDDLATSSAGLLETRGTCRLSLPMGDARRS